MAGLAAASSAMIKWLGRELPVVQVLFVRALIGAAVLLPFAMRLEGAGLRTRQARRATHLTPRAPIWRGN